MSLPVAEERALTKIEQGLLSRDPRLTSLFSIFTRLTRQEAMPTIEQLGRRRFRLQPGAVVLVAIALIVCAVVAGSLASARTCSPSPAASAAAKPSAISAGGMITACTARSASGGKAP